MDEIKGLMQNDIFRFVGFEASALSPTEGGDSPTSSDASLIRPEREEKLRKMARFLIESKYHFQVDVSGNEAVDRWLDTLEQINASTPLAQRRIGFVGLENATPEILARIKKLAGGIIVHDGLVLTGEYAEQSGLDKGRRAPPLRTAVDSGIPLGAGTNAFQSGKFSPMLSLWWLITGKTVAGSALRAPSANLTRPEALRAHTIGNAWFTFEEGRKGSIEVGKLADLAVLNGDYLTIAEDQIPALESILTIIGGHVVYAAGPYGRLERK
jgi:predicted amidohydrolase YtcJ